MVTTQPQLANAYILFHVYIDLSSSYDLVYIIYTKNLHFDLRRRIMYMGD